MGSKQLMRGLHLCERRDAGDPADALAPRMCWRPALSPNTDIQQPGRGLHIYEQREAHELTDKLVPTKYIRSIDSMEVLSRRITGGRRSWSACISVLSLSWSGSLVSDMKRSKAVVVLLDLV